MTKVRVKICTISTEELRHEMQEQHYLITVAKHYEVGIFVLRIGDTDFKRDKEEGEREST